MREFNLKSCLLILVYMTVRKNALTNDLWVERNDKWFPVTFLLIQVQRIASECRLRIKVAELLWLLNATRKEDKEVEWFDFYAYKHTWHYLIFMHTWHYLKRCIRLVHRNEQWCLFRKIDECACSGDSGCVEEFLLVGKLTIKCTLKALHHVCAITIAESLKAYHRCRRLWFGCINRQGLRKDHRSIRQWFS